MPPELAAWVHGTRELPLQALLEGAGVQVHEDTAALQQSLGLRTSEALLGWIADAGLQVLDRLDVKPVHAKAQDASDPLHAARSAEVTSLWRLGVAAAG
jgi:flagellar biosynthesis/type III secretory pathway ATPase